MQSQYRSVQFTLGAFKNSFMVEYPNTVVARVWECLIEGTKRLYLDSVVIKTRDLSTLLDRCKLRVAPNSTIQEVFGAMHIFEQVLISIQLLDQRAWHLVNDYFGGTETNLIEIVHKQAERTLYLLRQLWNGHQQTHRIGAQLPHNRAFLTHQRL